MPYQAAVRALTELTAKRGDLDHRFTPAPSAQEGMAGHTLIASRRGAGYLSEIALSGEYSDLRIRGRADGYDPDGNRLEEFKTHRGDVALIPENHRQLHWAQLRIYGHLLCRKKALGELTLALVYFDILTQQETVLEERHTAESLERYFNDHAERFLSWARLELAHRTARNEALSTLRFPHSEFHAGQRQLAEAVYRTASKGGSLLAQAPTGLGKTLGTLFPALKAARANNLDKVFFLVAKTSGRRLALDALRLIQGAEPSLPIRVLELVAREKVCEYPGNACHGAACPLASGFYDRLAQARQDAVSRSFLDQSTVRAVALAHRICPYYLSQELARWCDVIVADYNYYFDSSALLYHLTLANQWKVAILVDEAHNLIERGRAMYTSSLDQASLQAVQAAGHSALAAALDPFARAWQELLAGQSEAYKAFAEVPGEWLEHLQATAGALTRLLTENPTGADQMLLRFYFDLIQFARLAREFAGDCVFDVTKQAGNSIITLRNLIPARFLQERFAAASAAILFSATLAPACFYRDMLGLPQDTQWLDVPSPFRSEQLSVHIRSEISTRYRHRGGSLSAIVDLMARQYSRDRGNYLAFFSSYDYLERVHQHLTKKHPELPTWKQERYMSERERDAFLERFSPCGSGIGFAVLGGAFAEGIDLPGERLIGAFIATLGLPQVNPVNQVMQLRIQEKFGAGYEYTYLHPGLRKVIQAAGRVIRGPADRGTVLLIDDRFALPEIQSLLPGWWNISHNSKPAGAARSSTAPVLAS